MNSNMSEAKLRAACAARLGMPLTDKMLGNNLAFCPSLPVIESEPNEHEAMNIEDDSVVNGDYVLFKETFCAHFKSFIIFFKDNTFGIS